MRERLDTYPDLHRANLSAVEKINDPHYEDAVLHLWMAIDRTDSPLLQAQFMEAINGDCSVDLQYYINQISQIWAIEPEKEQYLKEGVSYAIGKYFDGLCANYRNMELYVLAEEYWRILDETPEMIGLDLFEHYLSKFGEIVFEQENRNVDLKPYRENDVFADSCVTEPTIQKSYGKKMNERIGKANLEDTILTPKFLEGVVRFVEKGRVVYRQEIKIYDVKYGCKVPVVIEGRSREDLASKARRLQKNPFRQRP